MYHVEYLRQKEKQEEALFSLKQEAPASIGGSTFTIVTSKKAIFAI